ncbi:MAG: hypothetical protein ABT940_09110 [Alphaproteobacteria bacterium]
MAAPLGEYGAVVARPITVGDVTYPAGTEISAEDVMTWPASTRRALANVGKLRYRDRPPAALETKRRNAGSR